MAAPLLMFLRGLIVTFVWNELRKTSMGKKIESNINQQFDKVKDQIAQSDVGKFLNGTKDEGMKLIEKVFGSLEGLSKKSGSTAPTTNEKLDVLSKQSGELTQGMVDECFAEIAAGNITFNDLRQTLILIAETQSDSKIYVPAILRVLEEGDVTEKNKMGLLRLVDFTFSRMEVGGVKSAVLSDAEFLGAVRGELEAVREGNKDDKGIVRAVDSIVSTYLADTQSKPAKRRTRTAKPESP